MSTASLRLFTLLFAALLTACASGPTPKPTPASGADAAPAPSMREPQAPPPQTAAEDDAEPAKSPSPRARTLAEAEAVRPLVGPSVGPFLDATTALPDPQPVYLVCAPDKGPCRRASPDDEGAKAYDTEYFFTTKYGSPLSYARPLELVAIAGVALDRPMRVLDFGYGYLGHLAMLAHLGHDVHGVEVDPILPALYANHVGAQPGGGRITLHHGRLFVDEGLVPADLGRFDVILSKNVLKRGYIHPEVPPPDRPALIELGHDDETFVRLLYERLNPGGVLLLYNLSPKQAPEGEPWIPWADGRCPFSRAVLEGAGFEVVAYDAVDHNRARVIGRALGWEADMDLTQLFALYTLARRPVEG